MYEGQQVRVFKIDNDGSVAVNSFANMEKNCKKRNIKNRRKEMHTYIHM